MGMYAICYYQEFSELTREKTADSHSLDQVEHRHSVPYRTQDRVSICREDEVTLLVYSPAKIAELDTIMDRNQQLRVDQKV